MGAVPNHFSMLSSDDQAGYLQLKAALSQRSLHTPRPGASKASFSNSISKIRAYAIRNDRNDALRCLVCGIIWSDRYLALNILQLSRLLGRCQASVNGGFKALGYAPVRPGPDLAAALAGKFPSMPGNGSQMRQWTIRVGEAAEDPRGDPEISARSRDASDFEGESWDPQDCGDLEEYGDY